MLIEVVCNAYYPLTEVWVSNDDVSYTRIGWWAWYSIDQAGNMNIPADSTGMVKMYALSEVPFRYVRVGSTDASWVGNIFVDAIKLDGQAIFANSASAVDEGTGLGFVSDPNNILAEDATLCHIRLDADGGGFVGVMADFGQQQPANPWPDDSIDPSTFRHGVYLLGYPSSDPDYNPPDYTYTPNPVDIAPYDWVLINDGTQELLDQCLAINPSLEWYEKISTDWNETLEYNYDSTFRTNYDAAFNAKLAALPSPITGVSLDEENWYRPFRDWNVSTAENPAVAWLAKYSTEVFNETGIDVTVEGWPNVGSNSSDMRFWLGTKAVFHFDALYDLCKAFEPTWKVQQYIVGNTWRWTVPADIKRDQWHIYQDWQNLRQFGRTLNYKGTDYPVSTERHEFDQVAWNCRSQAGLSKSETLCRVMANAVVASSGPVDVNRDLALLAEAGIESPFYFYYGSYVPPNPDTIPTFDDTNETAGQWSAQDAADWRHSYAQRVIIEKMFRLTAYPGDTASTDGGTWLNEVPPLTYQWVQAEDYNGFNPQPIAGETSATYLVREADVDLWIGCQVTATNADGSTTVSTEFAAVLPLPVTFQAAWAQHATQTIQLGLPR